MSGRLVILPKKSWHVWNADNVEKVLRDERLDREKKEKDEINSRELLQEQQFAILKGNVDELSSNKSDLQLLSVCDNSKKLDNEEYIKEKEAQELLKKKRDGIAPWGLGEGAAEKCKIKPWYHYPEDNVPGVTVRGQQVVGYEAAEAKERDERRKIVEDPMAEILKENSQDYHKSCFDQLQPSNSDEINIHTVKKIKIESIQGEDNNINSTTEDKNKVKKKKEKNEEKKKRRHQNKIKDPSNNDKMIKDASFMEALRHKRLQREKLENKRANILLATSDIFGRQGSSTSCTTEGDFHQKYSQQYNPSFVRHYK